MQRLTRSSLTPDQWRLVQIIKAIGLGMIWRPSLRGGRPPSRLHDLDAAGTDLPVLAGVCGESVTSGDPRVKAVTLELIRYRVEGLDR